MVYISLSPPSCPSPCSFLLCPPFPLLPLHFLYLSLFPPSRALFCSFARLLAPLISSLIPSSLSFLSSSSFPSHPLPYHTPSSSSPPQLAEMRAEYQRENEDILDNIRQIAKEVQLQALVMDHFIPLEYQVTKQHTLSHIECCTNEVLQVVTPHVCPIPPSPPTSCGLDRQCCMITQNGRRTLGSGTW